MKRFTLFTLVYLAMGACFTIVAFHQQNMIPIPSKVVTTWLGAFNAYLFALLSVFPWWHLGMLSVENWLRHQPSWQRILITIGLTIPIALMIVVLIIDLLRDGWSAGATSQICLILPAIAIGVENFLVTNQVK